VNLAHGFLVAMHAIQIFRRIVRQERMNYFDPVAKSLEGDPHAMYRA
jgi:hypothetical protein